MGGTVEHLGDKGAKGSYHAAKKIDKSILHDEDRSGEQDAMEEVFGTSKGVLNNVKRKVNRLVSEGITRAYHAWRKIGKFGIFHDEDFSGEQDAMKEVSGTSKGLLGTVEHLGDKGAKEAYHAAKKIDKKILHDEDRSGEQDAMKEVSGTSRGLLGTVEHLRFKGSKSACHAAKKIAGPGG